MFSLQNLYDYTCYRDLLKKIIELRKTEERPIAMKDLAKAIRVQPPYVSKVFKQKAHFSPDQLYLIKAFLDIPQDLFKYLELLLSFETSSLKARQDELKEEIKNIQTQKLEPSLARHTIENGQAC